MGLGAEGAPGDVAETDVAGMGVVTDHAGRRGGGWSLIVTVSEASATGTGTTSGGMIGGMTDVEMTDVEIVIVTVTVVVIVIVIR